jgi:dephospho-CoA kinase
MSNDFFSVGITGGIGSGKSLVCKIFSVLGIPIYSSDERAKWLLAHDDTLRKQVTQNFGQEAYDPRGNLNRSYLANIIFKDESNRQLLNKLVHPQVDKDYQHWRVLHTDSPYTLKEASLLFETGSYRNLDKMINISAPETLRMWRVLLRDAHRDRKQVEAIMQKQWTDEKREKMADYTIRNDEQSLLIPKVLRLHRQLLADAS